MTFSEVKPCEVGGEVTPTSCEALADASSALTIIDRYRSDVATGLEYLPSEVGSIKGYARPGAIKAALALAMAYAGRVCQRNSGLVSGILWYVAERSDNEHGRCLDSAQRIAEFFGCHERTVRDVRDELIKVGVLRSEPRPGQPVALWLPYANVALETSCHAIMCEIAPPRRGPGRPKSGENDPKTPDISHPTISEKPRILSTKTPDTPDENPGHLMSDYKTSPQELPIQDLERKYSLPSGASVPSSSEVDFLELANWWEAWSLSCMIGDQSGVCGFESQEVLSAVTPTAIASAIASQGVTAPVHLLTPSSVEQFVSLVSFIAEEYMPEVTADELLSGICAALARLIKKDATIRSLAIVAQPILRECHAGNFSWATQLK